MANSKYLRDVALRTLIEMDLFVSLHSGDAGEAGAAELTGEGYQRQRMTPARIAEAVCSNSNTLQFRDLPAAVATHFGVWDAEIEGRFLLGGPLVEPKQMLRGQGCDWDAGELILRG